MTKRSSLGGKTRAISVAVVASVVGILVTALIVAKGGVETEVIPLLVAQRALPYLELFAVAFLLDRSFPAKAERATLLGAGALIAVDLFVAYTVYWRPQESSTDGVFAIVATVALVFAVIPGAVLLGLLFAGSQRPSPPA